MVGIGFEFVGVEMNECGFIKVDYWFVMMVECMWVIGEVVGMLMFMYVLFDDYCVLKVGIEGCLVNIVECVIFYVLFIDLEFG